MSNFKVVNGHNSLSYRGEVIHTLPSTMVFMHNIFLSEESITDTLVMLTLLGTRLGVDCALTDEGEQQPDESMTLILFVDLSLFPTVVKSFELMAGSLFQLS